MEIIIPDDLRADWDRIVAEKFDQSEAKAVQEAIRRFIDKERQNLPKAVKFGSALDKVAQRQEHKDDILQDEMTAAFERMKKRREKGLPI